MDAFIAYRLRSGCALLNEHVRDTDPCVFFIHYCVARERAEEAQWTWTKLTRVTDPASPPASTSAAAAFEGIETVVPYVIGALDAPEARAGRQCHFCHTALVRDKERYSYLYRAGGHPSRVEPKIHFVVVAFHCSAADCLTRGSAWAAAARTKPQGASHLCAQCGKTDRELPAAERYLACGHCRLVNYCSPACQRLHWATHKAFCKVSRRVATESSSIQ